MKDVFFRWEDDQGGLQKGKMLFLNDEEGIQLIWRMQRSVERLKEVEIIKELGD